jgi:hypothetical protein
LYLSKRIADSKYPNWQWLSQQFAPQFLNKWRPLKDHESVEQIDILAYDQRGIQPIKDIDVLFTGSYLPWATERNETIRAVNEKFNLVIHSVNPWPEEWKLNVRPPIMDKGLIELIARSKLCLAIDHTLEAGYWSDRIAQYMACGGFVLTRYVAPMEAIFRQKVEYFYNIDDCLNKIESYLKMPQEDMDLMASIGYNYAHEELMVINTVSDLLTIVEAYL